MTIAAHPAPARHAVGLPALWFGLFGAPAAWTLQELSSYVLMSHACLPSMTPLRDAGSGAPWTIALIVSVVAIAVGASAGLVGYRSWRRTWPAEDGGGAEAEQLEVGEGRARFMAFSGILLSTVFLLNLLMNAVVLLVVPPCG